MKKFSSYLKSCGVFLFVITGLIATHNSSSASTVFGDTTVVQTLQFDTTLRAGMFLFPSDTTKTYEKIIMLYSMRCKDGLISTQTQRNLGCGEWDYNCYTYLIDSTQTDSLYTAQPTATVSNFSGSVFNYTSVPTWTYYQTSQTEIIYTSVISESTTAVGTGADTLASPFGTSKSLCRSQYLWTAAELSAAGLTMGNITGLKLDILSLGSSVNNLRIRFKQTSSSVLNPESPELTGFTEVYYLNTTLASTGLQAFNFHTPFLWNGTSNILVEFSYLNSSPGTDNDVVAHNAGFDAGLVSAGADSYINFNGSISYVNINNAFFDSISSQISIAFWVYGDPAKLPANTSILEAYDSAGRRQLNIHLPWSDSNVYWDCGNDGTGYDRISKAASVANLEGQWNFWVFTKNTTTGNMRIFLNGAQWNIAGSKTKPIDIARFVVGRGASGTNPYYGSLDELSIWNVELNAASIQLIMNHQIENTHPDYAHLLAYYKFNEDNGLVATDMSPNGFNSDIVNPAWRHHTGTTLFRNFLKTNYRPNTTFVKGVYNLTSSTNIALDSVQNAASSVIEYSVDSAIVSVDDTLFVWPAGYTYVYDSVGVKVDSIAVNIEDTLNISQIIYYRKRPMKLELLNFITPYGIGLDLDGLNGKTWIFDVTDFAPVLKGSKYLAMEDGKFQEDNDIKFVFYEGTPPRNVKSISQIWPNGSWVFPSYNEIVNNNYFEPRIVTLDSTASSFKLRSAISGHGQEGEFIQRSHTLRLISSSGTTNYTRTVWTECANNPIYPQGGTWIYDRAGWCPGEAVNLREFEITNNVTPGESVTLDYLLPNLANPGSSTYRVNNQLVTYGAPNFSLDATVDSVKTPSRRTEFIRFNPICNTPLITIKNTGSTTLTSLDITYGREGGALATYHWTGSLAFLQKQDVSLPAPVWTGSSTNRFVAYVSNPNGGTDQYAWNDTAHSDFDIPVQLPSALVFELRTNNVGSESSYTLKNSSGAFIISRSGLASNTYYRDTVNLNTDCYTVALNDAGDDGLSFWNNAAAGSGVFQIKNPSTGIIYKTYNGDFGDNIYQQFTVNYILNTYVAPPADINGIVIFPNPAKGIVTARFDVPLLTKLNIRFYNALMQEVLSENIVVSGSSQNFQFDTERFEPGVYFLVADAGGKKLSKRIVITR